MVNFFDVKKFSRTSTLLGIVLFPWLSLLLCLVKSVMDPSVFRNVAVVYSILTIIILLWCLVKTQNAHSLLLLLQSVLNYKTTQILLFLCVQIELCFKKPFFVIHVPLFCFCSMVSYCFFYALSHSCIWILASIQGLFSIFNAYVRFRKTFFNAEYLQVASGQIPTFGQSILLLNSIAINEMAMYDKNTVSNSKAIVKKEKASDAFFSKNTKTGLLFRTTEAFETTELFKKQGWLVVPSVPIKTKLSPRMNNLLLTFLVQKKHMSSSASAARTGRELLQLAIDNPQVYGPTVGAAVAVIGATGAAVSSRIDNNRMIESNQAIANETNRLEDIRSVEARVSHCNVELAATDRELSVAQNRSFFKRFVDSDHVRKLKGVKDTLEKEREENLKKLEVLRNPGTAAELESSVSISSSAAEQQLGLSDIFWP
jgi:hypothetical protein